MMKMVWGLNCPASYILYNLTATSHVPLKEFTLLSIVHIQRSVFLMRLTIRQILPSHIQCVQLLISP